MARRKLSDVVGGGARHRRSMRYLRAIIAAAVAAAGLLVPASAGAQITSISLIGGQLGAEGASVTVEVVVQCEPGWTLVVVGATVPIQRRETRRRNGWRQRRGGAVRDPR